MKELDENESPFTRLACQIERLSNIFERFLEFKENEIKLQYDCICNNEELHKDQSCVIHDIFVLSKED